MTMKNADGARGARSLWRRFAAWRRRVVAVTATGAVAAVSLAIVLADCGVSGASSGSGPAATITRNGEVWLQGKITQDNCAMSEAYAPIGDVGCSIIVNGYAVSVVHGNIVRSGKPGTVTGLDVSKDQAGGHAAVYAQLTGPHTASILGAPRYYARISG